MEKTQRELINDSKTSVHQAVKAINEQEDKENKTKSPAAPDLSILTDPDALRTLAKSKLVQIIQSSALTTSLVPAIKELLDRIDGKPTQQQTVDMNVKGAIMAISLSDKEILDYYLKKEK